MKKILLILLFTSQLFATNWYCDGALTGTDNNGTSWADAFESFNDINWASIDPNDTLFISGGTDSLIYYETLSTGASGTAGNYLTIIAGKYAPSPTGHSGRVIIDGNSGVRVNSISVGDDYLHIKGLECRQGTRGIGLYGSAADNIIDSCYVYDFHGQSGIMINGTYQTSDMGAWATNNNIIRNCRIISFENKNTQTDCIYLQVSTNTTVENTFIWNRNRSRINSHSDAIQTNYIRGLRLYNNVIICDSGTQGMPAITRAENYYDVEPYEDSVIFYNNFMYSGALWHDLSGSHTAADNNYVMTDANTYPPVIEENALVGLTITNTTDRASYGRITVINYANLTGKTVTVNGSTITEGAEWTAATSDLATAQSIQTALDAIFGAGYYFSTYTSGSNANCDIFTYLGDAVTSVTSNAGLANMIDTVLYRNATGLITASSTSGVLTCSGGLSGGWHNKWRTGDGWSLGTMPWLNVTDQQANWLGDASIEPPTIFIHNTFVSHGPYVYAVWFERHGDPRENVRMINNIIAQYGGASKYPGSTYSTYWHGTFRISGLPLKVDSVTSGLYWNEYESFNTSGSVTGNGNTGAAGSWTSWVNTYGGTGVWGDPLFVDPIGYISNDGQGTISGEIKVGSPARNAGEDIQALVESMGLEWEDINGNARDNTPDIGAYNYGVASTDTIPSFGFTAVTGAEISTEYIATSPIINVDSVSHFWTTTAASFKINYNGTYNTSMKTADPDNGADTVYIKNTTGGTYEQKYTETVVGGGYSRDFDVTTEAEPPSGVVNGGWLRGSNGKKIYDKNGKAIITRP